MPQFDLLGFTCSSLFRDFDTAAGLKPLSFLLPKSGRSIFLRIFGNTPISIYNSVDHVRGGDDRIDLKLDAKSALLKCSLWDFYALRECELTLLNIFHWCHTRNRLIYVLNYANFYPANLWHLCIFKRWTRKTWKILGRNICVWKEWKAPRQEFVILGSILSERIQFRR